jgi:hypothetical protein
MALASSVQHFEKGPSEVVGRFVSESRGCTSVTRGIPRESSLPTAITRVFLLLPPSPSGPGEHASRAKLRARIYRRVLGIGATPLMHACQQADRVRVLKLLRDQEETIGYRDRGLRSALHYCMDAGTGGAVAQAAPELIDAPDAEGHTALHLAVIAGDAQLVAVLLANGADVNAKDLEGHSVLHWATGERNLPRRTSTPTCVVLSSPCASPCASNPLFSYSREKSSAWACYDTF